MQKTALITGASRGIGAAAAELFASAGYAVVINYRERAADADVIKDKITSVGGEAVCFGADVGVSKEAEALMDFAMRTYGKIDILVNNAGVSLKGIVSDCTDADYDRVFDANMRSVFNMCRAAVPKMLKAGGGAIVNVSSMWGISGASCESVYSASKAAVIGFTKAIAKELAPSGISVNCVAPGVVDTDMNTDLSADERRMLESDIPLGRFAAAADIAKTILYLASSPYTTGEIICQSGGLVV